MFMVVLQEFLIKNELKAFYLQQLNSRPTKAKLSLKLFESSDGRGKVFLQLLMNILPCFPFLNFSGFLN